MENAKELKEKLFFQKENGYIVLPDDELAAADLFAKDYKAFLDAGKTERECVTEAVRLAEGKGYVPFEAGKKYGPGDKVYLNNRGKALILCHVGSDPIEEGLNISAAHIDSPRLDLKQVPLYEDSEMALLQDPLLRRHQEVPVDCHPSGPPRRDRARATAPPSPSASARTTATPSSASPTCCPIWRREQMKRPCRRGHQGRGAEPPDRLPALSTDDKASERVKLNILKLLFEKYGITERRLPLRRAGDRPRLQGPGPRALTAA